MWQGQATRLRSQQVPDIVFAIPGDPDQRTGGYIYDRRLLQGLAELGWSVRPLRLPDGFPDPTPDVFEQSAKLLAGLPDGQLVLIDGLAFGAMPDVLGDHADRLALVALVHHPLGYETGVSPKRAQFLIESERRALRHARHILVTSVTTARTLVDAFDIAAPRICVALPGTDPAPIAQGSHSDTIQLMAVGTIVPRKNFVGLIDALAPWRGIAWELTIAGSPDRDPEEAGRLRVRIKETDLQGRIKLPGEVKRDALADLLDKSDLFVSSSHYEGFGMALAEAVARGLPVVAVAGGAVGDWMDPRGALLASPDELNAFSEALGRVLADPTLLSQLRTGALAARNRLPTWANCAAEADAMLRGAGAQ